MRFACQSCGKAYNLPEEKIADKSNVKLKCRVCGAIVEVKKQGEVVAAILTEGDNKRSRVSEAPAPLTSMMPDDSDDATHAIAVSDQILSESGSGEDAAAALMGHVKSALGQRGGLGPLPPPAPTGFGSPPPPAFGAPSPAAFAAQPPTGFGSPPPPAPAFGLQSPTGFAPTGFAPAGFAPPADFAPTPVPPPLSAPELPRAELAYAPSLPSGLGGPPPPLPNLHAEPMHAPGLNGPGAGAFGSAGHAAGAGGGPGLQNGSNGSARFGDVIPLPDEPLPPPMGQGALSASSGDMGSYAGPAPVDMQLPAQQPASGDDTTRKMLAALATGILIGFIIARLFF